VAPAFGALVGLHGMPESGPHLVVYLLILVSTADSAAYFVGRRLGKRRLAYNVSPGKSLEGVAGAMAAVAIVAAAAAAFGGLESPLAFVVLSLATALVSILGDLAESTFKRRAGVKDSGTIIPGHGGILDRIDGYTAAAPIFALGCLWQGIV
jgi:phosphatidate cytidylyltransferase